MRIAVATPSRPALEAALWVANKGGNAVDCAIAATSVAMVTEIGVCAPGAGGFVLVSDGGEAFAYDGYMTAPGRGGRPEGIARTEIWMEYGGGVTTVVGPGSIATPGIWAAMGAAHEEHGRVDWSGLLTPADRLALDGFSFGSASATYLAYSHQLVFGHDPASHAAVHRPDGSVRTTADVISMPDLAHSFRLLRREGSRSMHDGTLAEMIAEDMERRGGILGWRDLAEYRMERRAPLAHRLDGWEIDTNPSPAIGGEAVMGVLERIEATDTSPDAILAAQREVFERRRAGDPLRSPSTIHTSVVDENGTACALTASAGYGSGVIPTGTGIWMNNALGELELVSDPDLLEPGERLTSNMAPTVCRHRSGTVLAIGSPGADRITSALAQTLAAFVLEGRSLEQAVRKPRLHVIVDGPKVAVEPGIDVTALDLPVHAYDDIHMFFGGVGAALIDASGRLSAFADPRRDGAAGVSG